MSERKTTEIKLRVTPDEKARWQFEAERQGIALSELIRQTLNSLRSLERTETAPKAQYSPTAPAMRPYDQPYGQTRVVVDPAVETPVRSPLGLPRIVANPFVAPGYAVIKSLTDASPQEDVQPATRSVGTSDEVGSVEPWMFEARQDG